MATASILNLGVQIGLTGNEWLEIANMSVNGSQPTSRRVTAAMLVLLAASVAPIGPTGVATDTPSGTQNNYNVNGELAPIIGFVDLTPPSACVLTGLVAGFNGQVVIITNLGASTLTLEPLNSGSLAANQFRMPNNLVLTQNNSQAFKYSTTIGKWVPL